MIRAALAGTFDTIFWKFNRAALRGLIFIEAA